MDSEEFKLDIDAINTDLTDLDEKEAEIKAKGDTTDAKKKLEAIDKKERT